MIGDDIAKPQAAAPNLRSTPSHELMPPGAWWSVERALYGVAILVGAWLRLWDLGAQPLSPWEASNSWPAWLTANGLFVADTPSPTSALFYGLQWLLFWLGVNSDSGARFVNVVFGVALILVPWWWRGLLGRREALIFAALIAIDPWLLGFSRLADGSGAAITLGMLALAALYQVARQPATDHWHKVAAVAAGLLLVAGPMGWNLAVVVMWWGWLLRIELGEADLWHRRWLGWLASAALLGGTLGLVRIDALEWLASGTTMWLAQFDGRLAGPLLPTLSGSFNFWWPWLRLAVDAALLVPLGIGGFVILWSQGKVRDKRSGNGLFSPHKLLWLCGGWITWGVVLALLPGRSPLALPMLGVPLLVLAAVAINALLQRHPRELDWREAVAVVATLLILLVSGIFWVTALLANRSYDPILAQAALVIFGLALAILVAFGLWANRSDAAWIAAAMGTLLLLVLFGRSSWKLNYFDITEEPAGWQATIAHPEVRLLAGDVETLSAHRAGDPYQLPVQVQVAPYISAAAQTVPARPDPVVGWELRNMRNLTWVASPQVEEEDDPLPLVLTPAVAEEDAVALALPMSYAGSIYHVDATWLPSSLVNDAEPVAADEDGVNRFARRLTYAVQPWWRWLVYREPTAAPQSRDVVLWAPLDTIE